MLRTTMCSVVLILFSTVGAAQTPPPDAVGRQTPATGTTGQQIQPPAPPSFQPPAPSPPPPPPKPADETAKFNELETQLSKSRSETQGALTELNSKVSSLTRQLQSAQAIAKDTA